MLDSILVDLDSSVDFLTKESLELKASFSSISSLRDLQTSLELYTQLRQLQGSVEPNNQTYGLLQPTTLRKDLLKYNHFISGNDDDYI